MANFLCVSSYYKGVDYIKAAKKAGNRVFLLTSERLRQEKWPWDYIDETFYMHEKEAGVWNMEHAIMGLAHTMRRLDINVVTALDDFDVEKAAHIREAFRINGMGETTARYFRDKLAMRIKAASSNVNVPAFSSVFNDNKVNDYATSISPPWLVKPRFQASATGIKKIHNQDELWQHLHHLGEERHLYLIEQFSPGDVYHVDSLTYNGKNIFTSVSRYLDTPFEVAHGGGIFRSMTLPDQDPDVKALVKMNEEVMKAFGMQHSASHTEYIKDRETGKFVFLETSSRVGGAHLAEMVEVGTGINLWAEWAKIEDAIVKNIPYKLPKVNKSNACIIVSLSRYQHPNMKPFDAPEVAWTIDKPNHIGLIMKSDDPKRLMQLCQSYTDLIASEYHASLPAPDRPTS